MIQRAILALTLCVALTSSVMAAQPGPITELLPEAAPGVAVVDVAGLAAALAPALSAGPLKEKLDALVSRGLPDPRRDLREAGVAFEVRGLGRPAFAVVGRGTVDLERTAGFFRTEGSQTSQVAYRGVVFSHISSPGKRATARLGALDEETAVLSKSPDSTHGLARRIVDVHAGKARAVSKARGIALPAGMLVSVSFDVPAKLRERLKKNPLTAAFATVVKVTGTVRRDDDKKIRAEIALGCDSLPKAFLLKAALAKLHKELLERTPAGPVADALARVKFDRDGKVILVTLEMPGEHFAMAARELASR